MGERTLTFGSCLFFGFGSLGFYSGSGARFDRAVLGVSSWSADPSLDTPVKAMASPSGASEIPVPEEMEGGGIGEIRGDELEAFRRFQRYMRQQPSASSGRTSRKKEESEEEDEHKGGAPGPPPSWDGTGVFEDYLIKAKLWLATTKSKPKMRGPLLLKALTSTPFETFKHYARDTAWLADPKGAETLLDDMNRPEHYGDDRQEHMITAMSRITFHLKRAKGEHWRDYFARWETAMRKVHEHQIRLPDAYEGFLLINGLQLTDNDVKALLNYSRGDISPASIKDWLRKSESFPSSWALRRDSDFRSQSLIEAGEMSPLL